MGPDTHEIVHAFTRGTPVERQAVLAALPPSMTRDVALQLAGSDEPGIAVVALDQVTADHVGDRNPETGLQLAVACYQVCRRLFESYGAGPAQVYVNIGGRSAHFAVTALRRSGDYSAILELLDEALPWLERARHRSHLNDLAIARIEAHLQLGRPDSAAVLLAAVPEESRGQDVRFASLRLRLQELSEED
ncbi:MAG: tetratricopeptide repeat protein [Kiloniellaceae bacterium]